jgi:hypothetical protein
VALWIDPGVGVYPNDGVAELLAIRFPRGSKALIKKFPVGCVFEGLITPPASENVKDC